MIKRLFLFCLLAGSLFGTDWYVTTGSGGGSGTSGAPWLGTGAIVWGSIVGGDTLNIDGGSSGLTYGTPGANAFGMMVVHAGTTEADRITIRCWNSAGHNGAVTISGIQMGDNGSNSAKFVTIDGHIGTSTINMFLSGGGGGPGSNQNISGIYHRFDSETNNKYLYLDIQCAGGDSQTQGIELSNTANNTEIAYCNFHDVTRRAIREGGAGTVTAFGRILIHNNQIGPNVKDDGIGIDGGVDVYDNIIDGTGSDNSLHADGIQGVTGYWRIYRNRFFNHGQEIFLETVEAAVSNWLIYDNLIYTNTATSAGVTSPGIYMRGKDINGGGGGHGAIGWSSITIANNVFYGLQQPAVRFSTDSGNTLTLTSSQLTNNIFRSNSGGGFGSNVDMNESGEGLVSWASGGFLWKNNIFSNGETTTWITSQYATVAALQAAQSDATGNLSSDPLFTSEATFVFTLGSSSPAIGSGITLDTIFTTDFNGATRTIPWTRGAYNATAGTVTGSVMTGRVILTGGFKVK